MRTLRLLYGTAKIDLTTTKKTGDVVEFEDDAAAAQMVSGAWEDITDSINSKEKAPAVVAPKK